MAAIVPSIAPYDVDLGMHAVHRATLVQKLRESGTSAGLVVLEGGKAEFRHDTDHEIAFRQESFFQWAFGVKEPDFYGTIDVATGRSTLYVPRLGEVYRIWMGAIKTLAEWQAVYKVIDLGGRNFRRWDEQWFFASPETCRSMRCAMWTSLPHTRRPLRLQRSSF